MKNINRILNCTASNPMPEVRDQMGQEWFHHGAKALQDQPAMKVEGDSQVFECSNCKHQFRVYRGKKLGKLSDPIVLAKINQDFKDMRAKGWRPAQ